MDKNAIIKALREYCDRAVALCEKYKDDYHIANSFRMQAFGAVTFAQECAFSGLVKNLRWRELENIWEEYDAKIKQIIGI